MLHSLLALIEVLLRRHGLLIDRCVRFGASNWSAASCNLVGLFKEGLHDAANYSPRDHSTKAEAPATKGSEEPCTGEHKDLL
jgi:hypothetical protein